MYPFENESETKETCHSEFLAINLNYFMKNYSKNSPQVLRKDPRVTVTDFQGK